MMPLSFAQKGEVNRVVRIGGKDEVRRHLNNLGFVEGSEVVVVSELGGNLIVSVKDARVAIGKDMATRIVVDPVA